MKSKLLKPLLLTALATLPLSTPQPLTLAQSSGSTRTNAQPSAKSAEEKWERYTAIGEEFSVELPGAPFVFEERRYISTFVTEPMRTLGIYSDGVVYIVTSFDNPHEQESNDAFARFHWGSTDLKYARFVLSGDFRGAEYESTFTSGSLTLSARTRVYRAKSHVYLFRAIAQDADEPRIKRFFDSLKLGGRPKGTYVFEQKRTDAISVTPPAAPAAQAPQASGGVGPAQGKGGVENLKLSPREGEPHAHEPGTPYKTNEVKRKAVLVFKPQPGFTEEARRNNIQGVVRLRVILTSDGTVKNISVVFGLPDGLTEKAINAARHILFFPAEVDGRAVSQYVTLEYNFNIY